MKAPIYLQVTTNIQKCTFTFSPVIYNSYLEPNNVMSDEFFLKHHFTSVLLEALGVKDDSGVIYELINYR